MTPLFSIRLCILLAALMLVVASTAAGQPLDGELTGLVYDSSGRFVPNVSIIVEDEATCGPATNDISTRCRRWIAISRYHGTYRVVQLPPGAYRLTIPLGDFPPYEHRFQITAGESTWHEVTLYLHRAEQIDVAVPAPSLPAFPTVNGLGESLFTRADIDSMSLMTNGRNLQTFQSLVPGVVFTESTGTLAQFTALGQRRFSNRLTIDGMSADLAADVRGTGVAEAGSGALPAMDVTGGSLAVVSVDGIEQIQIRTTTAAPEYARSSGAQTSIITRSGNDRLARAAVTTFRPDALAVSTWFEKAGEVPQRSRSLWNGGAFQGGPVVAKRAHYFATWDRQRIDRSVTTTINVPSDSVRNAAPAHLRPYLDAFPRPNGPDIAEHLAEYSGRFPARSHVWAVSARLDASLSDSHRMFARFHRARSSGDQLTNPNQVPFYSHVRQEDTRTNTVTLGLTSELHQAVSNDLRANLTTHAGSVEARPADYAGAEPLPLDVLGPNEPDKTWVLFTLFPGPNGVISAGRVADNTLRQMQWLDTLTISTRKHAWRFGVEYARRTTSGAAAPYRYRYTFGGIVPFLQGQGRLLTSDYAQAWNVVRQSWAAFAQDRWRLRENLSLDFGARYSAWCPPASAVAPSLVDFDTLPVVTLRDRTSPWRIAQRLAPHVQGRLRLARADLRAGWSVVYDELTNPGLRAFSDGHPFVVTQVMANPSFPVPPKDLIVPPQAPLWPGDRSTYYAFSSGLRPSRSQQWNLVLDSSLALSQRFSLGYAGSVGRDLVYNHVVYGPGVPRLQVNSYSNAGTSSYHALLADYVGQPIRRLRIRTAYAWSHAIDTDSGEAPDRHLSPIDNPIAQNRGASDFDRRHILRLSVGYEVPSVELPSWARTALADWRVDLVGSFQSGTPVSLERTTAFASGAYWIRPDVLPGVPLWEDSDASPTGRRLNPAAFQFPTEPRQGTLGRNSIRGSALRQLDVSLSRTVSRGSYNVQFHIEAYNVFNLMNLGPAFVTIPGDSRFGRPIETFAEALGTGALSAGGLTPLQQLGGTRAIQFKVRVSR